MGKKKKNESGKRIVKRVDEAQTSKSKPPAAETKSESFTPPIRERPREGDSGLGVLKVVGIVMISLIVGSVVLTKLLGTEDQGRGDKLPGELCESTTECASGSICYNYKDSKRRCHVTCSQDKGCEPGYTCTSSAQRSGRRSTRVRAVCVENAQL